MRVGSLLRQHLAPALRNRLVLAVAGAGTAVLVGFLVAGNYFLAPPPDEDYRAAVSRLARVPARDASQGISPAEASPRATPVDVAGTPLTPRERDAVARGGESLEVNPAPPVEVSATTGGTGTPGSPVAVGLPTPPPFGAVVAAAAHPLSPDGAWDPRRAGEETPAREFTPAPSVSSEEEHRAEPEPAPAVYRSDGHRDPFRSLVSGEESDSPLLDLNGARLVGVARSEQEILALVEDRQGRSFALRPGERIRSGRLARVAERRAVFSLWVYGRTETRVLELTRGEGE